MEDYYCSNDRQIMLYDREMWQIILHNKEEEKIVLLNTFDHSLSVCHPSVVNHGTVHPYHFIPSSNTNVCPLCKQVRKERRPSREENGMAKGSFVAKDYFLLLDHQLERERMGNSRRNESQFASDPLSSESLNSGYYKRFFVEERKIGSGGFGSVFLCRHVIDEVDLGLYAVKKVPVGDNKPWLMKVLREVKALEKLKKHPNIVNYQHSWLEQGKIADFGPTIPCLFILMEFANGYDDFVLGFALIMFSFVPSGNLADIIFSPNRNHSENVIWNYFIDLCEGLSHLHQCGIIHRDLKPQNILVSKDTKSENARLLISDFGTSVDGSRNTEARTGNTGTTEYIAPELLRTDEEGRYFAKYETSCDVWSLGVILYAMAYGKLPFPSANRQHYDTNEVINEILNFREVPFPASPPRSTELKSLITALLQVNPTERPAVGELLNVLKSKRFPPTISDRSSLGTSSEGYQLVRIPSQVDLQQFRAVGARNPVPRIIFKNTPPQLLLALLFLFKLWTSLQPCLEISPNPLHFYPVVTLSLLPFVYPRMKTSYSYVLTLFLWIWSMLFIGSNSMCMGKGNNDRLYSIAANSVACLLSLISIYFLSHREKLKKH